MLQSHLPEGMSFEEVPLSTVLEEISKASGLDIKPWEGEGDRKVTVDVSDMTVNEALKAVCFMLMARERNDRLKVAVSTILGSTLALGLSSSIEGCM